ncbi:hypothetical protein BX600DRAFT_513750 [Xylariales sp. PMI_506]|nr:hypothetical protein BX600DRAFT_513750 [Xylariales sp. PMI_506]
MVIQIATSPPSELNLAAFESDFCFARLFDNFVWASFGTGWMDDAATGKLGVLPFEAVKALSLTNLGRLENTDQLKLKGFAQYGRVLRATAEALGKRHGGGVADEEVMLSVILLLLYALYYPYRQWEAFLERSEGAEEEDRWGEILESDRAAVISHLRGLRNLLNSCGPKAFQTPRMRTLFDCVRMVLTISGVYNRKRSHLDAYEWKTVPWALDPSAKTEQSKLMDIFVVIPGLLEEYESISYTSLGSVVDDLSILSIPTLKDILLEALRDQIAMQLQLLFRWRWEWHHRYGGDVGLGPQSLACIAGHEGLHGHRRLRFDHAVDAMARAVDITLYNALLIWLLVLLWKVEQDAIQVQGIARQCARQAKSDVDESGPALNCFIDADDCDSIFKPLSAPGQSVSLRIPALEICRVYEWQSRHHHLASRSSEPILLYIYPLGMATSILRNDIEVQAWISEMVTKTRVTSGYKSGRFKMLRFSSLVTEEMMDPELSSSLN